jgi:beta-N-acetylhexosaminidase
MKPSGENRLGQLLMVRLEENRWSGALERWLRAACPGGVLLAAPLPRTAEATHGLLADIARAASQIPLLAIREEGGSRNALRTFFPALPSPRAAADKGLPQVAHLGELVGEGLRLLGFNTNFAPLLDVPTPSAEHSLATRAFASDPRRVAQCGGAFARGLRSHKILACGKHFPGWGSVPFENSSGLPVSGKSMAALWREDLLPYRELLPQLPMVLISSAGYKAYDFDIPCAASLSPPIVDGLLRVKLGYFGAAVAYGLESPMVRGTFELGEAAIQAINAGCDLLVIDREKSYEVVWKALRVGLDTGKLSSQRIEQALERIRAAKKGLPHPGKRLSSAVLDGVMRRFQSVAREFREQEPRIA